MSRLSFAVKVGVGLAACSYILTILMVLAPLSWNPPSILVYSLCPACLLTITVDPSFPTVAFILAPLNAVVYGLLGIVSGKLLRPSER
jgi:hypothetical protein